MMICSVKIGEELSQAALTRGLGGPVKRTNICKLGFHVQDVIFLLICLGAFAAQIYVLAARGVKEMIECQDVSFSYPASTLPRQ